MVRLDGLSIVLFLLGGLAAYILLVVMSKRSRPSSKAGFIKVGKHKYAYDIGDNLIHYPDSGVFSGVDVFLPKRMPHIDINGESVSAGPEGKKIAKDLEQAIKKEPIKYDIEISEHHARLISHDRAINDNPKEQREILKSARLVVKRLDSCLKTWDESKLDNVQE